MQKIKFVKIPNSVFFNLDLSIGAKLLFPLIYFLDKKKNCFASNRFFAGILQVSIRNITRYIDELERAGLIEVDVFRYKDRKKPVKSRRKIKTIIDVDYKFVKVPMFVLQDQLILTNNQKLLLLYILRFRNGCSINTERIAGLFDLNIEVVRRNIKELLHLRILHKTESNRLLRGENFKNYERLIHEKIRKKEFVKATVNGKNYWKERTDRISTEHSCSSTTGHE